ncbi:hypothetical protein PBT90_10400 [Algoriphagus halophytocola]|uniref:hypothetical protein n=1 Tax=Algoriphagus halophytocola TaxID=2991499 RepID=UPI0022DD940E|nr:hypothetical protein [Algoriphagus sp. TR-M9]WBL41166.1 hypothetical protein PBT90_10400 [Algoriphagus sp. TR-M9]
MNKTLPLLITCLLILFGSCDREIEEGPIDLGYDFQPLEVGLFWIYEVDQTIYFGENDAEQSQFFYRDQIRSFYLNAAGEQVFVVGRSKSEDLNAWENVLQYTLIPRSKSLVRSVNNEALVTLVFPPKDGQVWDGEIYSADQPDDFQMEMDLNANTLRVIQEESDDEVTYRDHRFETYERGIGMVEKYDEVLTYCSRNDCLGQQLIDSGFKIQLTLSDYGKN